jgi:hypothetical protein
MSRGLPSMTALLGLLVLAGYQNRDKLAELLKGAGGGQTDPKTGAHQGPRWQTCSAAWGEALLLAESVVYWAAD